MIVSCCIELYVMSTEKCKNALKHIEDQPGRDQGTLQEAEGSEGGPQVRCLRGRPG